MGNKTLLRNITLLTVVTLAMHFTSYASSAASPQPRPLTQQEQELLARIQLRQHVGQMLERKGVVKVSLNLLEELGMTWWQWLSYKVKGKRPVGHGAQPTVPKKQDELEEGYRIKENLRGYAETVTNAHDITTILAAVNRQVPLGYNIQSLESLMNFLWETCSQDQQTGILKVRVIHILTLLSLNKSMHEARSAYYLHELSTGSTFLMINARLQCIRTIDQHTFNILRENINRALQLPTATAMKNTNDLANLCIGNNPSIVKTIIAQLQQTATAHPSIQYVLTYIIELMDAYHTLS